jgi:hypothetical protein
MARTHFHDNLQWCAEWWEDGLKTRLNEGKIPEPISRLQGTVRFPDEATCIYSRIE